jgi:drug/metabolite transporter (DMT)-like permease
MRRGKATAIGFGAVLLWALLALLTVGSAPVPPLLLNAMTFALGGALGLVWIGLSGSWRHLLAVRPGVYLFGAAGLFGYHLLYFSALRLAPPAEASLIAYLWPLFIVLMSGLLPGERLSLGHVAGALMSFLGAALIVMRSASGFDAAHAKGLILAFAAAVTWASYSVVSRRFGTVPTTSVAVFCLVTACLSALAHSLLEPTIWPATALGWASCLALGLGPVGLAFYLWDIGVKQGDIQLLGVSAYAAPLVSTLVLILAGLAPATPQIAVAAVLIAGGALVAARAGAKRSAINSG